MWVILYLLITIERAKMIETKRLSVDLDRKMHCLIKQIAAQKNITISVWVELAIREMLKQEEKLGFTLKE